MKRGTTTALTALLLARGAAHAATPCDFKGLSVGDKATPQQIMKHFGINKFKTGEEHPTQAQHDAALEALMKRADKVGFTNAIEEREWNNGPVCVRNYCSIPYGSVEVGSGSYPINVGVLVSFDKAGIIDSIDVTYSKSEWDEMLRLLNEKYGNDWRYEDTQDVTTNFETKHSYPATIIVLTHGTFGRNENTGDKCSIVALSRDIMWVHTTLPYNRAILEIKRISKKF